MRQVLYWCFVENVKNWQAELTLRHMRTIKQYRRYIQIGGSYDEWDVFLSIAERRGEDLSKVTAKEFNFLKSLAERLERRAFK